jgi:hypothetical protein
MAHATSFRKYGLVYALMTLSVCALSLQSVPHAAAQSTDQSTLTASDGDTLHLGAPLDAKGVDKGIDKGDKGKPPTLPPEEPQPPVPPKRPPTVPKSGPGTMFAIAMLGGAAYWTIRRSTMTQSFVAEKN